MKEEIERLLKAKFYKNVSYVEWNSYRLVIKNNGNMRVCIEF